MNLKFEQIIEKLENREQFVTVFSDGEQKITSARLIDNQQSWEKDLLYIGYANQMDMDNLTENSNFLLICTYEQTSILKKKLKDSKSGNWCLLPEVSLSVLFNRVQEILSNSLAFVQSSAVLFNSIIQGRGLKYIMEIASELLGNPVMLGDNNHRLLACSRCDDVDDNAWNEYRDTGYCTYEYTVKYDFKPWVEKSARSKGPVIGNLGEISNINRIFAIVKIGDAIVGNLAVLEHKRPFSEKDLEVVAFICDLISSEMQKNHQYFNSRKVMLENLILDLLNGNHPGKENILERIKYIKWQMPSKMYVLAIEYNSYEDTFSLIPYISETLKTLLAGEEAVIFENKLVLILGCGEGAYLNEQELSAFDAFLKQATLKAGISQEFNDILELRHHFDQAVTAISLGHKVGKEETVYLYEDYGIYHMIQLAGVQHDVLDFCHPTVLKLKSYDREHRTEYLKTVYAYVSNMKNLIATAESLFIHRNTLSYRMSKIRELIGECLDDDEIAMKIFLSYKILEYTGKL
ncbi:PucR family transcriptional regulator [Trichococcus shcherbakoviae]|nr:helix-turn-helix domain-containing protein [Trichococcus shcherbakoviae]